MQACYDGEPCPIYSNLIENYKKYDNIDIKTQERRRSLQSTFIPRR